MSKYNYLLPNRRNVRIFVSPMNDEEPVYRKGVSFMSPSSI